MTITPEQLRNWVESGEEDYYQPTAADMVLQAADEIEQLNERVRELEEELNPKPRKWVDTYWVCSYCNNATLTSEENPKCSKCGELMEKPK